MLDDGTPYIVMELLTGENLEQRIARLGSMALGDTVNVLGQCCKALARAHAAGIVHRDIKPDNIFLARTPDDEGDVVKVLDFGIAKMTMDRSVSAAVTGTGALLGTPRFMSPEQVQGSKDVDPRTDLYSLGLVAFTMLTGRPAMAGDTLGQLLLKICVEPLPSLTEAAPGLPPPLGPWFQRACARQPADRHPSAEAFIETLRAACGDARTEAGSPVRQRPAGSIDVSGSTPGPAIQPSLAVRGPAALASDRAGAGRRKTAILLGGACLAMVVLAGGAVGVVAAGRGGSPAAISTPGASVASAAVELGRVDGPGTPAPSATGTEPSPPEHGATAALEPSPTTPSAPPPDAQPSTWSSTTSRSTRHAASVAPSKPVLPEPSANTECYPPCRKGYICSPRGLCVSACNPPCGAGQRCSGEGLCVSSEIPPVAAPTDSSRTSASSRAACLPPCRIGYVCDAQGRCVPRP
jgi:serine/threonine-protein kinase